MSDQLEQIKSFYKEAFQIYDGKRPIPDIEVRFYPYIGINHTIRVRDGKIFVRIAEICRAMPPNAQKALAYILVAKLLRKKVSPEAREIYSNFIKTQEIRALATENKRARGRKIISSANGDFYNLDEMFASLNGNYFQDKLPKPVLSWSARKTYRILGHHDSTHETVIISKSLDDKKVPKYVVEYVLFHEMLHIFHPTEHRNGRRFNHTPQFRRNERKYAYFEEAENWIERNVKNLKRNAKRK
ncbi:MAG: M48 family metallopeptidase [Pyrinomonadaceae bacterium]|nr:M48 family metallopeptidase [Pyrinomonadaceae bacterium]